MGERLPQNALEMRHALMIASIRAWHRGFCMGAGMTAGQERQAWAALTMLEGRA